MNETDLRRAFGRISPDETLIRATIEKVEAQKYTAAAKTAARMARTTDKKFPYAAVSRLAGAFCALLLVVGLGISLGTSVSPATVPDSASYTRTHFNDVATPKDSAPFALANDDAGQTSPAPAASYGEEARVQLLTRAEELNAAYIILDAELCSCSILPPDTDGYACMLSFDQATVVAASDDGEAAILGAEGDDISVPVVRIRCADAAEQESVINAMGSRMCVLIYLDGDTYRMDPTYILAE